MLDTTIITAPTPLGDGRLFVSRAVDPRVTLVLGHGAGGGVDAFDLAALALQLPEAGISVVRFEQPWRTAGKKVAVAPPRLDESWVAAIDLILADNELSGPRLLFGGRSAGARVACRTASRFDVAGIVALSFPLHPPGKPEKSRAHELVDAEVVRLVLQGERDPFGSATEIAEAAGGDLELQRLGIQIVAVPGADHGLKVAKTSQYSASHVRELIVASVRHFCLAGE